LNIFIYIENTDNICSQVNTSFTSSTLPKLYLSLMSEKEFIHRNSESKKKSNQQNFSICGNLIIEPTRVSLKKIYHKKELKEIAQQSKEKSFSNDETLYKNNIKNKYIKNNDNLSNKPSADVETIGKCLFKHLYISDSDKRKYFSFFVKVYYSFLKVIYENFFFLIFLFFFFTIYLKKISKIYFIQ